MIQLLNGDSVATPEQFVLESVDAEIFPLLLVWLLEWAGISEDTWSNNRISGHIQAEDLDQKRLYDLNFTLDHKHVHEGLYQRSVDLQYRREIQTNAPPDKKPHFRP